MTNTNELPTKKQIDALIEKLKVAGVNNAADLLSLASDEISQFVRENTDETCCCYEVMGDNPQCPKHGGMFKGHGGFFEADYFNDYRERDEIYAMGMGR